MDFAFLIKLNFLEYFHLLCFGIQDAGHIYSFLF